jgi:hypothetical protein
MREAMARGRRNVTGMHLSDHDLRQLDDDGDGVQEATTSPGAEAGEAPPQEQGEGKAPSKRAKASPGASEPGRPKGATGHSRTQQLPADAEHAHAPDCCAVRR